MTVAQDIISTEPRQRRWTRQEYHRLAEKGFFKNQRVELINGRIIQMAPHRHAHAMGIVLVNQVLSRIFQDGFYVRVQLPLNFGRKHEPEPDIAVIPGDPRLAREHPSTAALLVEVSDTTLRYDRQNKGRLYARHGIADYWILNLVNRQLEIHREPVAGGGTRADLPYGAVTIHNPADLVEPLAAPGRAVRVADLLP